MLVLVALVLSIASQAGDLLESALRNASSAPRMPAISFRAMAG
jgi:hypothetical protein